MEQKNTQEPIIIEDIQTPKEETFLSRNKNTIFVLITLIFLIFIIVVGVFYYLNNKNENVTIEKACSDLKVYYKNATGPTTDSNTFYDCIYGISFDYPKSWGEASLSGGRYTEYADEGKEVIRKRDFEIGFHGHEVIFSNTEKYINYAFNYPLDPEYKKTYNVDYEVASGCVFKDEESYSMFEKNGVCKKNTNASVEYTIYLSKDEDGRKIICNEKEVIYKGYSRSLDNILAPILYISYGEAKTITLDLCPNSINDPIIERMITDDFNNSESEKILNLLDSVKLESLSDDERIDRLRKRFEKSYKEVKFGALRFNTLPSLINSTQFLEKGVKIEAFRVEETKNTEFIQALKENKLPSKASCDLIGNTTCFLDKKYGGAQWVRLISFSYLQHGGTGQFANDDVLMAVINGWVYSITLPYSSLESESYEKTAWYSDEDWEDLMPGTMIESLLPENVKDTIFNEQLANILNSIAIRDGTLNESYVEKRNNMFKKDIKTFPTSQIFENSIGDGFSYGYIQKIKNINGAYIAEVDTLTFQEGQKYDPLISQDTSYKISNQGTKTRDVAISKEGVNSLIDALALPWPGCYSKLQSEDAVKSYLGDTWNKLMYEKNEVTLIQKGDFQTEFEKWVGVDESWLYSALKGSEDQPSYYGVLQININNGFIDSVNPLFGENICAG